MLFLFIFQCGFGQWSVALNAGIGEQRREIPEAYQDNILNPSLAIDINYKPDSIPLIFNLTPYLIPKSVSEVFPAYNNFLSFYYSPVIVMSGVGIESDSERFIKISTLIQLGYWHTRAVHNYNYSTIQVSHEWKSFERKLNQFAIGPRINVGFGKRRLKGVLTYENYFLSSSKINAYSSFGRERFTRISLGLSYGFD